MLNLSDPMGAFFTDAGNSRWHCQQTGVDLAYAHLDFFRKYEGVFGLPLTNEISLAQLPSTAIVVYECAIAIYDPGHKTEEIHASTSNPVYLLKMGQHAKPLVVFLQAQIQQLQQAISQTQAVELLKKQLASYQNVFHLITAVYR